jgi:ATP-dependent DNA helicase RecG
MVLRGGKPSLEFAAFVFEQEQKGEPLLLDDLIVLNALFFERRVDSQHAGMLIQKGAKEGRATLEKLVERGFVEAKGERKGRVYHLGAELYRRFGDKLGYVRIHGISAIKHENMVMEYVDAHGRIERKHVVELCGLSGDHASRLLRRLVEKGQLLMKGSPPRWVYYEKPGR